MRHDAQGVAAMISYPYTSGVSSLIICLENGQANCNRNGLTETAVESQIFEQVPALLSYLLLAAAIPVP